LFNLFKMFKSKTNFDGFSCDDVFVGEQQMPFDTGISFLYTCYFSDYYIAFEYKKYTSSSNILGISTLSYQNTVIYREQHNLNLSNLSISDYLKQSFKKIINYARKFDTNHLNIILPFFKTESVFQTKSLELMLTSTYPRCFIYTVSLMQAHGAKYNSFLNRTSSSNIHRFPVISYDNKVFDCLSPGDYRHLARLNQDRIYQIDDISSQIKKTLDDTTFTVHAYDNQYTHVFLNTADASTLFYGVINSQKEYYPSHLKEDDDFFNDISLHVFWMVNFENRTTALNIFIYDDDKLIEEYSHSMDTKFEGDLIDLEYYSKFFQETLSKLVHCYYPNRKLIELLNNELSLDEIEDRLTEEQYHLFKMITI